MAESRLEKLAAKQEYGTELCRFLGVLEKNAQLVGIGADLVADAIAERREESGIVKIALACIGMAFVSDDSAAGGGVSYRLDDLEAEGLAARSLDYSRPAYVLREALALVKNAVFD